MLKTLKTTKSITRPEKGRVGVSADGSDDNGHDDKHSL